MGTGLPGLGLVGPWGGTARGEEVAFPLTPLLSSSERVHRDQEEVQVPLLQLLGHAPVHPQEAHALPHWGAALPLRDLREEVHAPGAHEAAHAGECRAWSRGLF